MMLTSNQDPALASAIIDHIVDDLTPGEVFGNDAIKKYAKDEFSPSDIHSEDTLIAWARDYSPEEIFLEDKLSTWALENGFIKAV